MRKMFCGVAFLHFQYNPSNPDDIGPVKSVPSVEVALFHTIAGVLFNEVLSSDVPL